jgi:hypothetical protein
MVSTSPIVEHASYQVTAIPHINDVVLLFNIFNWFKSLLKPLFQTDTHFEMPEILKDSNETFQSSVASLIKPAVVEKLIHGVLLTLNDYAFDALESCF